MSLVADRDRDREFLPIINEIDVTAKRLKAPTMDIVSVERTSDGKVIPVVAVYDRNAGKFRKNGMTPSSIQYHFENIANGIDKRVRYVDYVEDGKLRTVMVDNKANRLVKYRMYDVERDEHGNYTFYNLFIASYKHLKTHDTKPKMSVFTDSVLDAYNLELIDIDELGIMMNLCRNANKQGLLK